MSSWWHSGQLTTLAKNNRVVLAPPRPLRGNQPRIIAAHHCFS